MAKDTESKLVSMIRTAEDKRGDKMAGPAIESTAPDYPYGLCIHMDKDELDKLGITKLPEIGTEMMIEAKVKVTRVSQSAAERADGSEEYTSVDFQITDIGLEKDD
jgi:hypothetical protein